MTYLWEGTLYALAFLLACLLLWVAAQLLFAALWLLFAQDGPGRRLWRYLRERYRRRHDRAVRHAASFTDYGKCAHCGVYFGGVRGSWYLGAVYEVRYHDGTTCFLTALPDGVRVRLCGDPNGVPVVPCVERKPCTVSQ